MNYCVKKSKIPNPIKLYIGFQLKSNFVPHVFLIFVVSELLDGKTEKSKLYIVRTKLEMDPN